VDCHAAAAACVVGDSGSNVCVAGFFLGGEQLPIPTRYKLSAKSPVTLKFWHGEGTRHPPRPRMLGVIA